MLRMCGIVWNVSFPVSRPHIPNHVEMMVKQSVAGQLCLDSNLELGDNFKSIHYHDINAAMI